MEVSMSLNALVPKPMVFNSHHHHHQRTHEDPLFFFTRQQHSLFSSPTPLKQRGGVLPRRHRQQKLLLIEAKGKRGMQNRQYQPPRQPPLPKFEDDGNPRFVVFIRMANVYLWYPLSVISGGTTAKIMVAAKDNFLGKYIYKDTLARNLAAVIYRDEKEIKKTAIKQHRVLRNATEFRYGYKLVENNNMRAALSTTDVIELPTQGELKTVLDKVKDFFGDAKESFGKLTALDSTTTTEPEENANEKSKVKT